MIKDIRKIFYLIFVWLILFPLSLLFRLGVWLRNLSFDKGWRKAERFNVKVISIGNIALGGTGKTPMAEHLIRYCLAKGLRVAYLSRGYGRKTRGYRAVQAVNDTVELVGDEALQVALKFPNVPVSVCEKRVDGVAHLLAAGPLDVVILDDAFQHRQIDRDLDLVMIDANRPPWTDFLLPAGRLREPMSALKRADMVVVNKVFEEGRIRQFQKHISRDVVFTRTLPKVVLPFHADQFAPLSTQNLKRGCIVFSAIGNNDQFILEVRKMGLIVLRTFQFGDHYQYKPRDMSKIVSRFKRLKAQQYLIEEPIIITTEKDYIRLRNTGWFKEQGFDAFPFYYLTITLEIIRGNETFEECMRQFLQD